MHDTPASSKGHAVPWAFGVLMSIYFLFPHLLIWPLKVTGVDNWAAPIMQPLFTPVRFLYEHSSAYHALMEKETEWTGVR